MFKLWLTLELANIQKKTNNIFKSYIKLALIYIVPTLGIILLGLNGHRGTISAKTIIINLIIVANMISTLTHFIIYLSFFKNLEKDVIIKFLPDKLQPYIKVRVFMVLVKWTLPLVSAILLSLRPVLNISNPLFILSSILFIASWFIFNYLIAIYIRYFLNTINRKMEKVLKFILGFWGTFTFIVPNYGAFLYLNEISSDLKKEVSITNININVFHIITLILIFILALVLFYFSENHLNLNIRKIVKNRSEKPFRKRNQHIEKLLLKVTEKLFRNITPMDKLVLQKDIKELSRDNRGAVFGILITQIIYIICVLAIYHDLDISGVKSSIEISMSISFIIFIYMGIIYWTSGRFSIKNILCVSEDTDLLGKYNINFNREDLIKVKRNFAGLILFYPMGIIYVVALLTRYNIWGWLGLISSLFTFIILERLLSLNLVNKINGEVNNKRIFQWINTLLILATINLFTQLLMRGYELPIINSALMLIGTNVLLIIIYMFNLYIKKFNLRKREN